MADKKITKLKYMIHHHIASRDHYDFRLELNGVYLSWAVPKGPSFNSADKRLAVLVEDHTIEFGDFEGVIPEGEYGAGVIMVWDSGVWETSLDAESAYTKGKLDFVLYGDRLKGRWKLVRFKGSDKNWLLIKEKDEYSMVTSGIEEFITSVKTGRTFSEIKSGS